MTGKERVFFTSTSPHGREVEGGKRALRAGGPYGIWMVWSQLIQARTQKEEKGESTTGSKAARDFNRATYGRKSFRTSALPQGQFKKSEHDFRK